MTYLRTFYPDNMHPKTSQETVPTIYLKVQGQGWCKDISDSIYN
jgi:hypothetical protein